MANTTPDFQEIRSTDIPWELTRPEVTRAARINVEVDCEWYRARDRYFIPEMISATYALGPAGWELVGVHLTGPCLRKDGQPGGWRGWKWFGGRHDDPVTDVQPELLAWAEAANPGHHAAVEVRRG